MTLHSDLLAGELLEAVDTADVDQRGGQEAADPEVEDEAALDDLDDRALDRLAGLGGAPILRQAFSKRARFLRV